MSPGRIALRSAAFDGGASIPSAYTCDGADRSPPLAWDAGPSGTACYALVLDDPDAPAGTWVHWVAWNLRGTALGEGVDRRAELPGGARQGRNSWGRCGYGGPCPPSGEHRYVFHLYALDRELDLPSTAGKAELLRALEGHVLAEGELVGRYRRPGR